MKIIDLLCLIIVGEEVPKKIRYNSVIMQYNEDMKDYERYYGDLFFRYLGRCSVLRERLNDEVEILDNEEDEKAEIPVFEPYHIFNHNAENFTGIKEYINGKEVFSLASEIEEDKDIPLIPDDELYEISNYNPVDIKPNDEKMDYNFKVLKEKINQVVEEFNKYRKENE